MNNIMNIDEMLPRVKETELEILKVVDKFCKENNIKYSLAYGTLLGAVRHKGFIPWDDDIDIFMLREDYERFIDLWLNNPVDGYILENKRTNPYFDQCFTKIRKDHTTYLQESRYGDRDEKEAKFHTGIFIDVFPLDKVADNSLQQKLQKIYAMMYFLYTRGFAFERGSSIVKIGCKLLLGVVPKNKYLDTALKFEKKLKKYNNTNNNLICFDTMEDLSRNFDSEMMNEVVDIEFENAKFKAVKDYKGFLTEQYGDYMQLPPEEERVWYHHPIVIDFEHNWEEIKDNYKFD